MNTGDRDPRTTELPGDNALDADIPDALDRLLAETRVAVAPAFTQQVMGRLPEAPWRRRHAARREWAIAAALALLLAAVAAVLVSGGDSAQPGVGASIVDLVIATFAAGAGFLAASWRGLGATVNAAFDGSPTALLALGLAALAANGLLYLLLRRRRAPVRSSDDE